MLDQSPGPMIKWICVSVIVVAIAAQENVGQNSTAADVITPSVVKEEKKLVPESVPDSVKPTSASVSPEVQVSTDAKPAGAEPIKKPGDLPTEPEVQAAPQTQENHHQVRSGSDPMPPDEPALITTRPHRKAHKAGRRGRARTRIIRVKMTRRPRISTPPPDNRSRIDEHPHQNHYVDHQRPPTRAPGFRPRPTTEEQKLFIVNPQNGVAARPDLASPDIKSSFQGYNSAKDMISMSQDSAPRKWTSLTITSGSPPFVKGFEKLPRTEKDAVAKGWLPIDDYDCDGEYTNLGRPYMLSEDPAIILLFDKSGYIAGLQTALSETEVWESRDQGNTFKIEDSGYFMQIPINGELHFALTALFVEPEIICSTGRTPDEFDEEGTGTGLYIVVAGIAVKMEMRETDLDKNVWMSGNFFPGMGNHYFAQIDRIGSEDHPVCDDWVPFFLLYNRGYLNAFGWTFFGRYKSSRFEYQSTISYPVFMDPIPQCVEEITSAVGMTTFHILFETFYRNLGFK